MFDDLISELPPPLNRVGACTGDLERHFTEGAVMTAFALHLLQAVPGLKSVAIHPDGEHGKRFPFRGWLEKRQFVRTKPAGGTDYGGEYLGPAGQSIVIIPTSGRGDVCADVEGRRFVAECKGGVINTTHPGQLSRLKRGLCEAVGLLLCADAEPSTRQFAVAPLTALTEKWAKRMNKRARAAGVEIALVGDTGRVFFLDEMGRLLDAP